MAILRIKRKMKSAATLAAVACMGLAGVQVQGATYEWDGRYNRFWADIEAFTNKNNWNRSGFPMSGDDVKIGTIGTSNNEVDLDGNRTIRSLTFGGSGYSIRDNTLSIGTGDVTSSGSGLSTIRSGVRLMSQGNWAINSDLLVTGVISTSGGAYGIIKTGGGKLTLDNANSYTGTTQINGGQIVVGHVNALQNSTVNIATNGGLNVTTNSVNANIAGLMGNGSLSLNSQSLIVNGTGAGTTYNGQINGGSSSKLELGGSTQLTLTRDGSQLGGLRIQPGGANALLTLSGANITLTGSILPIDVNGGEVRLTNGSRVTTTSGHGPASFADGLITVTGSGTKLTSSTVFVAPFGNSGFFVVDDSGELEVTGALTVANGTNSVGDLKIETGGTVVAGSTNLAVNDAGSSATVLVNGLLSSLTTGSLNLGGVGGTGTLDVTNGGTLAVTGETYLGTTTSAIDVNEGTFSTGTLNSAAGSSPTISLTDLAGAALTVGAGDGDSNFGGVITDGLSGSGSLHKVGDGALELTAANTYSGETTIEGGKIVVGHADALQNSRVNIQAHDGLDVVTNSIDATVGGLEGSGSLNLGSQTLTVNETVGSTVYSGVISGDSDSTLKMDGTGGFGLVLTGSGSEFGRILVQGGSQVILDGADILLTKADYPILVNNSSELHITNGTQLNFINTSQYAPAVYGDGLISITDAGTKVNSTDFWSAPFTSGGTLEVKDSGVLELSGSLYTTHQTGGSGLTRVLSGGSIIASVTELAAVNTNTYATATVDGADSSWVTGRLHLGGRNTFVGGTAVVEITNGGTMEATGETLFATAASSITVDGGTFLTGSLNNFAGASATINLADPSGGVALTVGTDNSNSTFDGLIQNVAGKSGSLSKVGTGSLTLTAANTYSGTTTIEAGKIVVGHVDALKESIVDLQVDGGLDVVTHGINVKIGGLSGNGDLHIGAQALLVQGFSGELTYSGELTGETGGRFKTDGGGTTILTGSGGGFNDFMLHPASTVVIDGGDFETGTTNMTFFGTMKVRGGGTLTHGNVNDVRGGLVVETLAEHSPQSLRLFGNGVSLTVQSGGILTTTGNQQVSTFANSNATYLVTGAGSTSTMNALILGHVDNSQATVTVEDGGHVEVRDITRFDSAIPLTVNGGTFVTGKLYSDEGIHPTIRISDPAGAVALTIGGNNQNSEFYGSFEDAAGGAGTLRKTGTGRMELYGNLQHTGGTVIDGGRLDINSFIEPGNSSVIVNNGGTLGGYGTVAGGVTVNAGGTISPGPTASTGTLTVSSDVDFNADSTYKVKLDGVIEGDVFSDMLFVDTSIQLGGHLDFQLLDIDYEPLPSDLIQVAASPVILGEFDTISDPGFDNGLLLIPQVVDAEFAEAKVLELWPTMPGDFNLDGSVNIADLIVWAQNFGDTTATFEKGDANLDRTINIADLIQWAQVFGKTTSDYERELPLLDISAATAIPEPSGLLLLGLGTAGLMGRRRRD